VTGFPPPDELTGEAGELADRFIDALEQATFLEVGLETFVALPVMLALGVGWPDPQGSGRPRLDFAGLRERIRGLVQAGLDERFLVQALRDEIGRFVDQVADTKQRERDRRAIEELLADPLGDGRVREMTRLAGDLSDEDTRGDLQRLADRLAPPDTDEVAAKWRLASTWESVRDHYLGDADLHRWHQKRFAARHQTSSLNQPPGLAETPE
jgi:hypothetical protein